MNKTERAIKLMRQTERLKDCGGTATHREGEWRNSNTERRGKREWETETERAVRESRTGDNKNRESSERDQDRGQQKQREQ